MAFKYMTGTTCGNGQTITFIADDGGVTANDFFQLDSGLCVQITAIGSGTTDVNGLVYLVKEYASCAACIAPITANTEQVITYYLNSDLSSGSATTKTFIPPHPVWTDNQGHGVVQFNMITIGGNGLNS